MALRFKIPEEKKTDRAYWDQPLWYRIYMRILYAFGAFIIVGSLFDLYTPAPLWFQIVVASSVALATLLYRVAYPNGFSDAQRWILEGMQEAAKEQEEKGKTPNLSSEQIAKKIEENKEDNDGK